MANLDTVFSSVDVHTGPSMSNDKPNEYEPEPLAGAERDLWMQVFRTAVTEYIKQDEWTGIQAQQASVVAWSAVRESRKQLIELVDREEGARFTYTILTFYEQDGPCEEFELSFRKPVHLNEDIEVPIDGWDDGLPFYVDRVEHREDKTILFCECHDNPGTEGLAEVHKKLLAFARRQRKQRKGKK